MGCLRAISASLALAFGLGLAGAVLAADYQRVNHGVGWLTVLDQMSYEDRGEGVQAYAFETFTALPARDGSVRSRMTFTIACAQGLMRQIRLRTFDIANRMERDVAFPASRWRPPGAWEPLFVSVCYPNVRAKLYRLGGKSPAQIRFERWERTRRPLDPAGQAMLLAARRGPVAVSAPPAMYASAVAPAAP